MRKLRTKGKNKSYYKISHWLKGCIISGTDWTLAGRDHWENNRRKKKKELQCNFLFAPLAQPVVFSPRQANEPKATIGLVVDARVQKLSCLIDQVLNWRVTGATITIITMSRFYGQQIYALDNKEYFPDKYNEITHSLVATILAEEDYLRNAFDLKYLLLLGSHQHALQNKKY